MGDYLDPLPADLAALAAAGDYASGLGLETVEAIIARLEQAKQRLQTPVVHLNLGDDIVMGDDPIEPMSDTAPGDVLLPLSSFVKTSNGKVTQAHKEWTTAWARFNKSVEKKFTGPPVQLFPPQAPQIQTQPNAFPSVLEPKPTELDTQPQPTSTFSSPLAIASLNSTFALHLARLGAFSTLSIFLKESSTPDLAPELLESLKTLHKILNELRSGVCTRALEWIQQFQRQETLEIDSEQISELEFQIRKEEFIQILLADSDLSLIGSEKEPLLPSDTHNSLESRGGNGQIAAALRYGGIHFRNLMNPARREIIGALLTAPIYMPFNRLLSSPYAHLFQPYIKSSGNTLNGLSAGEGYEPETELCAVFAAAYLKQLGLPKESPLSVVTDIGGGGAMARIQKVRNVMKEKRTEWSAKGELPVEIPLPASRRYHSIFACPVSKEQSTPQNPPMLLPCGHVIAKDSLTKLAKGHPTLKCPYCPVVSHFSAAVKIHL